MCVSALRTARTTRYSGRRKLSQRSCARYGHDSYVDGPYLARPWDNRRIATIVQPLVARVQLEWVAVMVTSGADLRVARHGLCQCLTGAGTDQPFSIQSKRTTYMVTV